MTMDRSFVDLNRAATGRLRSLVARLSDADYARPVGNDWTVAVALAHLAFWDARAKNILDLSEQSGRLVVHEVDIAVNDFALPLFAAVPPREAGRLAIEAAESMDARLEGFPGALLEEVFRRNQRFVIRALHRNEHLDEVDAALKR